MRKTEDADLYQSHFAVITHSLHQVQYTFPSRCSNDFVIHEELFI